MLLERRMCGDGLVYFNQLVVDVSTRNGGRQIYISVLLGQLRTLTAARAALLVPYL
jgi:hypothetical protein